MRASSLETAAEDLRRDGLWAEATALESPCLLEWAVELVSAGGALTAADDSYPQLWLSRLGASAPPAVWISGVLPSLPYVAIVGSREVNKKVFSFARDCGAVARRLGYAVVSGGAKGCDTAAMRGAIGKRREEMDVERTAFGVEILPYGLGVWQERTCSGDGVLAESGKERLRARHAHPPSPRFGGQRSLRQFAEESRAVSEKSKLFDLKARSGSSDDDCGDEICRVSVCAPDEEFSTGSAMERNALIYAMADAAVIAHARFKTGGTWHGAIDAHRRRLARLVVRMDDRNEAHRALIGLGAVPLREAAGLEEALNKLSEGELSSQKELPELFASSAFESSMFTAPILTESGISSSLPSQAQ